MAGTFRGTFEKLNVQLVDAVLSGTADVRSISVKDPIADPYGGERLGLKLETTLDRTKFGLNWNAPLPSGGKALANEVTLTVDGDKVTDVKTKRAKK